MKKLFFASLMLLLFAGMLLGLSCTKDYSCENCRSNDTGSINKPPVVIAGPDKIITLPTDSILLNGSSSNDPDGRIIGWIWTKIAGPVSFNIGKPNDSVTIVNTLITGAYQFELKVTDDKGLTANDTVKITVRDLSQLNRSPIANAGPDQVFALPINTITLDGSASTDPDNNIVTYSWTKISGLSGSIANSNAVQTQVTNLVAGVYQFDLKVTDAGGLFARDTVTISINSAPPATCDNSNRPLINAQLVPVGNLSQPRMGMSVASAGNKIVFAGGYTQGSQTSRADIYDITTNAWSSAELCVARDNMATVTAGNKVFFGGGESGDGTWPVDAVDIYDVSTNTWTVAHLSSAGNSIAGAAVGNKVFFAGGDHGFNGTPGINRAKQVDIYDITTNTWSTTQLSEEKHVGHCAVTVGEKIYFSGGEIWQGTTWSTSNKNDIYDNATNSWSTSTMVEQRLGHTGIAVNDKIYWAGGIGNSLQNSCLVEVRDVITGITSLKHLFKPGFWWHGIGQKAVLKNNKIVFLRHFEPGPGPNKFDIYDITTDTWSIGVLPFDIENFTVISVNNTIYIAGGSVNDVHTSQVWTLEF